ncbi:MAG: hypothetical protein H0T68_07360 [Gemmatimonadales bacterium]|nr:hypothetical protein [Gemmatimonadales bacterium]
MPNGSGQSILYAIGGRALTGGSLGKVQAYNVATNTWTTKASLPIAAYLTNGAGVIGGKIYVSGGVTRDKFFRRELHVYDPATNAWTRKRDMPDGTWGGVTGVSGEKLYVLTCGDREEDCYVNSGPLFLYRYDPATDQWTFLSFSPPQTRHPMGGFIGGRFYVTGDDTPTGDGTAFHVYDPATNQWTPKAPLPRGRWSGAGVTLGAKLYVIGGSERYPDGSERQVRSMIAYDPASDTWSAKASMPTVRPGLAASRVVFEGQPRIEVVGGSRPGNNIQYTP